MRNRSQSSKASLPTTQTTLTGKNQIPSTQKTNKENVQKPQRQERRRAQSRGKSAARIFAQLKKEDQQYEKANQKKKQIRNSHTQRYKAQKVDGQGKPAKKLSCKEIAESQKNRIRNMKATVQNSDKVKQDGTMPIKLVLVGDGSVGKTCMLISYTTNNFPTDYVPTIFDNYVADIKFGSNLVKLWLWDTAGQEEYAELRLISYQKADIFLICFSLIDRNSFDNALDKWLPEVHDQCPKAFKILVGTKSDLHSQYTQDPKNCHRAIPLDYINKKVQGKNCIFLPCSGLDQKGLNKVFEKAMQLVIERVQKRKKQQASLCQMI